MLNMKSLFRISLLLFIVSSCTIHNRDLAEKYQKEIIESEKAFAKMATDKGMAEAFLHFAAEDAVINRKGIIHGKDSIKAWFNSFDHSKMNLCFVAWRSPSLIYPLLSA